MTEEFFKKKRHRHVREIPLAPVLDLLVVVIFFLLLSTSFIEFNKQTLPPSGVHVITDPVAPPPLAPKFLALRENSRYQLNLRWAGAEPGQTSKEVGLRQDESATAQALQNAASDMLKKFQTKFPNEKSLQMGLGPNLTYQEMISLMDGVRESLQDIVLISYQEAVSLNGIHEK